MFKLEFYQFVENSSLAKLIEKKNAAEDFRIILDFQGISICNKPNLDLLLHKTSKNFQKFTRAAKLNF